MHNLLLLIFRQGGDKNIGVQAYISPGMHRQVDENK